MFYITHFARMFMAGWNKQYQETPEDRLKRMILERLNDAQVSDSENKKKSFCINTKNFLRLMKPYMGKEVINEIEGKFNIMEAKRKELQAQEKNPADIEAEVLQSEYALYDDLIMYGIDVLPNSRIMQKKVGGIILAGKTIKDLKKLGEKIRKSKAVERVMDDKEGLDTGVE